MSEITTSTNEGVVDSEKKKNANGKTNSKGIPVADIAKIGLFVALISVSGYITFTLPFTPVAITAQTLALNLAAILLKPKQSFIAVLVYILLGIIGVPVFSGGRSGIGVLIGPSGGYIVAFLIAVPLISLLKGEKIWRYFLTTILIGIPVIDLLGTIYYSISTKTGFYQSLVLCCFPFLIGDTFKAVVASLLGFSAQKALSKINV